MFAMPSMWNLVISTLVFFIAAWYFHRYLDEQGIPKGMTRGILVFTLASVVSWGAGEVVDLFGKKTETPKAEVQKTEDLLKLLNPKS